MSSGSQSYNRFLAVSTQCFCRMGRSSLSAETTKTNCSTFWENRSRAAGSYGLIQRLRDFSHSTHDILVGTRRSGRIFVYKKRKLPMKSIHELCTRKQFLIGSGAAAVGLFCGRGLLQAQPGTSPSAFPASTTPESADYVPDFPEHHPLFDRARV